MEKKCWWKTEKKRNVGSVKRSSDENGEGAVVSETPSEASIKGTAKQYRRHSRVSSHKNKVIRERLERIYGKGCMFQKALIAERIEAIGGIKTYKEYIEEHRYSFKKVKKLEETMTLHHIKHRANGGATSERNGAVVNSLAHGYLHSLERAEEEIVNGMLREYKAGIDSGRYERVDVELVEDLETGLEINFAELSLGDEKIEVKPKGKYNRAKVKEEMRRMVEEDIWERD